jgi:hypothetical protein
VDLELEIEEMKDERKLLNDRVSANTKRLLKLSATHFDKRSIGELLDFLAPDIYKLALKKSLVNLEETK